MENKMVYAGFWKRWCAGFIDGLILMIPNIAMNYVAPYVGAFALGFLYYPLFYSSPLQATPGKAIMGLVVQSEDGNTLTLKAAIIRHACTFLSVLILCVGYLMNLFTPKRQTLHDMIAGSVVIMKDSPEVNYFQVWLAEIKKIGGDQTIESYNITKDTPQTSAAKAIDDLHKLFQSGAITQAEYESKKAELLSKI
jgi:uncharacterized RDD family membrane protein YckC